VLRVSLVRSLVGIAFLGVSLQVFAGNGISFEGQTIRVRVTRNGGAALFGYTLEPRPYRQTTFEHAELLTDSDGDGFVEFILEEARPVGLWTAIDMSSGQIEIAAPNGRSVKQRTLPPAAILHRSSNAPARVEGSGDYLTCWLVRPGSGAWTATVLDGTSDDADGLANERVTFPLAKMKKIGASPDAPTDFTRGDVLTIISPFTF
jgi:hypothetical protein